MAVRQYIGARYVPIFGRKDEDSIIWDNTGTYEPLTVVLYQGNSYTSRQFVPVGIEITNEDYWAETGNYNAQVEQYRQEVFSFDDRITQNASDIDTLEGQLAGTAESGLKTAIDANAGNISTHTAQLAGTAESGLKTSIDANAGNISTHTAQLAGTAESGLKGSIDNLADQLAGTTESGLKTSIDANAGNISTHTAQLAGTAESGLGTLLASVDEQSSRLLVGGTVMPAYVGSFEGDEQNASCIRIGDNIYTFSPNNYDGMGSARIWSLIGNNLVSNRQILMGHANSVAYDTVRDCIWLAPMATYYNGTATPTNVVYRYNTQLTSYTSLSCQERMYGVSFDQTTGTLYGFAVENGTDNIRIYKMSSEESEFTLLCTIVDSQFSDLGHTCNIYWQDFAVRDSLAVICKLEGTCYVIDLSSESPSVIGTLRVSHYDVGGLWKYSELEGIEFDATGRLYAMWQCPCGFTNTNKHFQHSVGFVTEINTQKQAPVTNAPMVQIYGSLTMVSESVFCVSRSQCHTPNEVMWRSDPNFSRIIVPSELTLTIDTFRVQWDMTLEINGTLIVNNTISLSSGNFFLYINGGTLQFNTENANGVFCISSASREGSFAFRCREGHLVNTNSANFFSSGFCPMLVSLGVLDNIDSVTINGQTRTELTLCMGSYQVWHFGS